MLESLASKLSVRRDGTKNPRGIRIIRSYPLPKHIADHLL